MSLIPGELAVMCMYEKNGVHVYLPYMEMKPLSSLHLYIYIYIYIYIYQKCSTNRISSAIRLQKLKYDTRCSYRSSGGGGGGVYLFSGIAQCT